MGLHRSLSGQDYKIKAMSYQYPETPFVSSPYQKFISHVNSASRDVPDGWMAYRHPEGALYFVHGESVSESDRYDISIIVS